MANQTYNPKYMSDDILRRYAGIELEQLTNVRWDLLYVLVVPPHGPLIPWVLGSGRHLRGQVNSVLIQRE